MFEATISTAELFKYNPKKNMELNKTYAGRGDKDSTKRFQEMFPKTSVESERYSGIWNDLKNSTLMGTYKYQRTPFSVYTVLCRYKKITPQLQVHAPPAAAMFVQSGDTDKIKIGLITT